MAGARSERESGRRGLVRGRRVRRTAAGFLTGALAAMMLVALPAAAQAATVQAAPVQPQWARVAVSGSNGPDSPGSTQTCAIDRSSALWCWGGNDAGQLGLGDTMTRWRPVHVSPEPPGAPSTSSHGAPAGSAPTRRSGAGEATPPASWARGATAPTSSRRRPGSEPQRLGHGGEAQRRSLRLTVGHELWCWGWNLYGRLGVGDTEDRWAPTQVPDNEWVMVDGGGSHTCALKADLSVWCWGWNVFASSACHPTRTTTRHPSRWAPTRTGSQYRQAATTTAPARPTARCGAGAGTAGASWAWATRSAAPLPTRSAPAPGSAWASAGSTAAPSRRRETCGAGATTGRVSSVWATRWTGSRRPGSALATTGSSSTPATTRCAAFAVRARSTAGARTSPASSVWARRAPAGTQRWCWCPTCRQGFTALPAPDMMAPGH